MPRGALSEWRYRDDTEIVRYQNYGQSRYILQRMKKFIDTLFALLVQTRRRLIEQQDVRLAQ